MLQKTNRMSLVDQVVQQMEALIESGEWLVGSRIPAEPELVAQLDVSRNTVREATRALVHAGLLKTRQGDGTYVCASSSLGAALHRRIRRSDLLETLEVRYALEHEAARLAAQRRTYEDVEKLRSLLLACNEAAENKDMAAYVEADIRLHIAVMEATYNSVMIDLYEHMTGSLRESIGNFAVTLDPEQSRQNHDQLVEAIIAQDTSLAMEAVRQYIDHSRHTLQNESGEI